MELFITGIVAFTSTNIDDIFILTILYSNKEYKGREILTGQLLGIAALITVSLIGSLVGLIVDKPVIGILGIFPLYLGIKGIRQLVNNRNSDQACDVEDKADDENGGKSKVVSVAGITMANGGDNIGVYVPLFATLTWAGKLVVVIIFLVMVFIWCLAAKYLASHPYIRTTADKYAHIVTPFLLLLLGLYILNESGTWQWLYARALVQAPS